MIKQLVKKQAGNLKQGLIEIVLSILLGFIVAGLILYTMGYQPTNIFAVMIKEGFSDPQYLGIRATPLILTGLAFSIPLLAGVFNIGGESQLYVGAITGLAITYYTNNAILGLIAGFIAGVLWGLLIAALRVYRGINEVISAIMLNWIAWYMIIYIILKYLPNPSQPYLSIQVSSDIMLGYTEVFLLGVLGAIVAYLVIYHTKTGFVLRVSGLNPKAAEYAGFNPSRSILISMAIGGGLAGYGGALLVLGVTGAIDTTMSTLYGLGFTGIGVGLLGRNHPIGIIFSALFLAGLLIGGQWVELETGVPPYVSDVIIGVIIIALSAPYAISLLGKLRKRAEVIEG